VFYSICLECKFNHREKREGCGGGGYGNLLYLKGGAMKKYFERMRGHEKFTASLEISSSPPPSINNDCSLTRTFQVVFLSSNP
jgi:hypothetical protein